MDGKLFDEYTDYLICSFGRTTATGLSRLTNGQISHDQVTRFLAAEDFTSARLWQLVKPVVRPHEQDDGVLIIDDTIVEKPYSDENDIVCWHWDHSHNRSVKGIQFLSAVYNVSGVVVPVGFDVVNKTVLYTDQESGLTKRKSDTTKNERCRGLLRACARNQIKFRYVLADCYFACAETMRLIKEEMSKDFVMVVKDNRTVALSLEDKMNGRYVSIKSLDLQEGNRRIVHLEGVPFPLALIKKVFTNKDGSQGVLYLVTSDLTINYDQILAIYHKRWSIEGYHESLKQNASLPKSPAHTERTQANHLFCSLFAFVKLEMIKVGSNLNPFAVKNRIYMAAIVAAKKEYQPLKQAYVPEVLSLAPT